MGKILENIRSYIACIRKRIHCALVFVIESIAGIVIISLFFLVLSHCWPWAYRLLTKWANHPTLPIVTNVDINCSSAPPLSINTRMFNVCNIALTFDRTIKPRTIILIYDSNKNLTIKEFMDNHINLNDEWYNFFQPSANKVNFTAVGDKEHLRGESINYEDAPFKLAFLEE